MKVRIAVVSLLALVAFATVGCGMVQGITGGNKGGTVANLWADVPPLPNATKANIDIPPFANLLVQGFIQAANADENTDTKLDKFDFIAFQTADTPQQVSEFYSQEKMTAAGWNETDNPGCQTGSGEGVAGGFCAFGKKGDAGKGTVLIILPVQDDSTKQTQVFYLRFEATKK